jgi:hypothetical protein
MAINVISKNIETIRYGLAHKEDNGNCKFSQRIYARNTDDPEVITCFDIWDEIINDLELEEGDLVVVSARKGTRAELEKFEPSQIALRDEANRKLELINGPK